MLEVNTNADLETHGQDVLEDRIPRLVAGAIGIVLQLQFGSGRQAGADFELPGDFEELVDSGPDRHMTQ